MFVYQQILNPTDDVMFGDFCLEIDTGDVYTFDGTAWQAQTVVSFVIIGGDVMKTKNGTLRIRYAEAVR